MVVENFLLRNTTSSSCIQQNIYTKEVHKYLIFLKSTLLILLGLLQKIQLHSQLQHGGVIKMMHYATSLQLVISTRP